MALTCGDLFAQIPQFDHVVVVVMENHDFSDIVGNTAEAPYINSLANSGANFTQSFAIEHPSQPNYLDLFSGSNQGVTDNSCPHTFNFANLGGQLIAAGFTFVGYSEELPSAGSTVCSSGTAPNTYQRKAATDGYTSRIAATAAATPSVPLKWLWEQAVAEWP